MTRTIWLAGGIPTRLCGRVILGGPNGFGSYVCRRPAWVVMGRYRCANHQCAGYSSDLAARQP